MNRLEQSLADYLQLRRSLGHQLADAGRLLPSFVAFLDEAGLSTVTVAAAMDWATLPAADPGSTIWPRRMTAVRGFARYLAGVDPATEVPPLGLLPLQTRWRGPFVFTRPDIELIINRVSGFTPPLRAATYVTLIGLLAATGLRIGEAIKLDRADLDWTAGVLLIRESKFGKSRPMTVAIRGKGSKIRYVPVMDPTARLVADYLEHRDPHPGLGADADPLSYGPHHSRLTRSGVANLLARYVRAIRARDLVWAPDLPVTPHTLRRTRAMHLIQAGVNLIYIRDLLGHADVSTTEIYARADAETKRRAIENAYQPLTPDVLPDWTLDASLIRWLDALTC